MKSKKGTQRRVKQCSPINAPSYMRKKDVVKHEQNHRQAQALWNSISKINY